jgi:hypothetical protein
MGSNGSDYPEDRLEPTADGKLGNEDLLAQVLRPDLSDGEKVRLLKENMPAESMTPGREAAMISLLDRLGRVVEGNDRQAGIGEVAEMLRGFAPRVFEPTRPEPLPRVPAETRATVLLEFLRATHAALVDELASMRLTTDAAAAAYELIGAVKTDGTACWPPARLISAGSRRRCCGPWPRTLVSSRCAATSPLPAPLGRPRRYPATPGRCSTPVEAESAGSSSNRVPTAAWPATGPTPGTCIGTVGTAAHVGCGRLRPDGARCPFDGRHRRTGGVRAWDGARRRLPGRDRRDRISTAALRR